MTESQVKATNPITVTLDNTSFNVYEDQDSATALTINVKQSGEINYAQGGKEVLQWAMLTIQSKTVKKIIFKFFKPYGTTSAGADQTIDPFGVTNNRSLLITLNEGGEFNVITLSANEFSEKGIEEIHGLISNAVVEAGGMDKNGVQQIIAESLKPKEGEKPAGDIRQAIDDAIGDIAIENIGEDGNIPGATVKTYAIKPSGWLYHSLGIIDQDDNKEIIRDRKPIHIKIKVVLDGDSFKKEELIYPYSTTNPTALDDNKVPSPWSLCQTKAPNFSMPLKPDENKFYDYALKTLNTATADKAVDEYGKPILNGETKNISISQPNDSGEYLIGGRFNGSSAAVITAIKDKISVHSQGALLLHVVFSVITPRDIYFTIENQYAPFVKILFYSFQIQSFYNGVLKYFYCPLYKKVIFKQKSFDTKGLFINMAPTLPTVAATKLCPIQNIYQASKFENSALGRAIDISSASSEGDEPEDEIDDITLEKTSEIFTNIRNCDFRYYSEASLFPATGTIPALAPAMLSSLKPYFNVVEKDKLKKKGQSFIYLNKVWNTPGTTLANPVQTDAIFEVIDKATTTGVDANETLVNPITPVVDFNTKKDTIALTMNNNTVFVIGKKFMEKFTTIAKIVPDSKGNPTKVETSPSFKGFDLIFNQKQFWLKIVLTKEAVKIVVEDASKNSTFLDTLFPQFGARTTISQTAIINGLKKIQGIVKDESKPNDITYGPYEITFKLAIKTKTLTDKTVILDPIDKALGIRPTTFTSGTITGTANTGTAASTEFIVEPLIFVDKGKANDKPIKIALEAIGITDL